MNASRIEWERDHEGNVRVKAFISVDDIARLHDDPVARVLMRKPEQTASDVCLLMESVFHRAKAGETIAGMRIVVDPAMPPDAVRLESGEHSVTLRNIRAKAGEDA